jgi:hypothetical protein
MSSLKLRVFLHTLQSVDNRDDLFPLEGPEDWTTPIQHPQSLELQRRGISLVLSDNSRFEFTVHTHTAEELRDLSTNTNRLEFHSREKFDSVSSVETEEVQTFLHQVYNPANKL